MAKGFGKTTTSKKLSRYAPLTKENNSIIRGLEAFTSCKYGDDFILDYRSTNIYAKRKVIRALNELQNELESIEHASTIQLIQKILELTEVTNAIEDNEFAMLMREALIWHGYKLLHDGQEPKIEKGLCSYTEEEVEQINEKLEEIVPLDESKDETIEQVISSFLKYLKSQGYFYHFTHYTMSLPD